MCGCEHATNLARLVIQVADGRPNVTGATHRKARG